MSLDFTVDGRDTGVQNKPADQIVTEQYTGPASPQATYTGPVINHGWYLVAITWWRSFHPKQPLQSLYMPRPLDITTQLTGACSRSYT